jgi:hypothetical protein
VTYTLVGSFFDNQLDFRNELITFVRKTVSPSHRKIKAMVRAEPTAAFAEKLRERNLQVLSKFDSYLTRPLRLRESAPEHPLVRADDIGGSPLSGDLPGSLGARGTERVARPRAVSAAAARDHIFISYRHVASNKKILDRLLYQLYDLEKKGLVDPWSDRKIEPGMKWETEIKKALESAAIAVLLVSVEFMASDFIREKELPVLLKRAERHEITLLPLILNNAILWTGEPKYSAFQAVNPPEKPLLKMSVPERDDYLGNAAQRIKAILQSRNAPVQ